MLLLSIWRERDRQTDTQTDKQTDRQSETRVRDTVGRNNERVKEKTRKDQHAVKFEKGRSTKQNNTEKKEEKREDINYDYMTLILYTSIKTYKLDYIIPFHKKVIILSKVLFS